MNERIKKIKGFIKQLHEDIASHNSEAETFREEESVTGESNGWAIEQCERGVQSAWEAIEQYQREIAELEAQQ